MLRREQTGARSILCDNGCAAQLLYYLLAEELEGCTAYGVEIVLHRDGKRESAVMRNITTSRLRMGQLLTLLCRNTVTPCTLQEIVADAWNKM